MKHEDFIKEILLELHEPWMNKQDSIEFDTRIFTLYGNSPWPDIELSLQEGSTLPEIKRLFLFVFKKMGVGSHHELKE